MAITTNSSITKETISSLIKKQSAANSRADATEDDVKNALKHEGHTRNKLTLFFISGFFGILIFCCIFVLVYNWMAVGWAIDLKLYGYDKDLGSIPFIELDKLLSIMIGAFGTSLGFIIGYFFKNKDK
ncbi:hypothetical protein ACI1BJ_004247 [Cronobacter dublinensis]